MSRVLRGAGLLARPAGWLFLAVAATCTTATAQVLDTILVFPDRMKRMQLVAENKLVVFATNDTSQRIRLHLINCAAPAASKVFLLNYTNQFGVYNWRRNKYYCQNDYGRQSLAIIDCANDSLVKEMSAGGFTGIAYNATLDRIYATADTAFVIDCGADTIVNRVPPHSGIDMAIWDSVGNKLYTGSGINSNWLYVIDCAKDTVKGRVDITGVTDPDRSGVATLHRRLYVTGLGDSGAIIDCAADRRIRTLMIGSTVFDPLVLEALGKVYWAGGVGENAWFTPGVTVVDIAGDSVLRRILPPPEVWGRDRRGLAYAPWNNRVYTLWRWRSQERPGGWGYIGAIDCATDSVLAWVPFANWPVDIVCNPYDHRIYVTCTNETMYVFRDELPGVAEAQTAPVKELRIHPNPARDWLELQSTAPADLIAIDGRRVATLVPGRNDVRALPSGVYFVRVQAAGSALAAKVVVGR